jgi:hypothetical protein
MRLGTYNYDTGEAKDPKGFVLGTFRSKAEAETAIYAAQLPAKFWFETKLPPIPLLQELNDWVIKQNEKRLPKWKFRFASDLAAQMQPKLTRAHAILFEGKAIVADAVSVKMFTQPATLCGSYWSLSFQLRCPLGETVWEFKPTYARRGTGCSRDGLVQLRQRMLDVLTPQRFAELTPDLMLSHQCLCCGKGLTDPASMARWIGPECWGSASTNLPHIFKAEERAPVW